MRFFGVGPVRQNLQILLIVRDSLVGLIQLLVALRHAEIGDCVFLFPNQRVLVAGQRGLVTFPFEVIVTDFVILHRPVGIPGMHLLHFAFGFVFGIGFNHPAVGMVLGVVFRRSDINPGVAAGTLPCIGCRSRARRGLVLARLLLLVLIRLRLLLSDYASS